MKDIVTFAQDSATNTLGYGTIIVGGVAAVWAWFRGELNDCKKDRKDLYARVDSLHAEVSALSMRVGNCERPKS